MLFTKYTVGRNTQMPVDLFPRDVDLHINALSATGLLLVRKLLIKVMESIEIPISTAFVGYSVMGPAGQLMRADSLPKENMGDNSSTPTMCYWGGKGDDSYFFLANPVGASLESWKVELKGVLSSIGSFFVRGGTRRKRHKPHKKRTTKRHKPHKKRPTKRRKRRKSHKKHTTKHH
jgi:hypothetical protein